MDLSFITEYFVPVVLAGCLATGYVGRNDEYTNTLSLYPNIELHKESQTKSGQKLKVKFDLEKCKIERGSNE